MAHYIGKFNSEQEIQAALDSGQLLKPYVAQYPTPWDPSQVWLDYNSKDAHIIVDGSVDPTAITASYSYNQQYVMVYADDLYWTIANTNNWITIPTEGYGNTGVLLEIHENPVISRNGNITVYFYTDSEKQNLKNTATLTIEQEGEGQMKPSFSDSEYIDSQSVSSASGSTNVYILNNPGSYYFKVSYNGEVTGDPQTTAYTINYAQASSYDDTNWGIVVRWYSDSEFEDYVGEEWLTLHQEGDKSLSYIVDDYIGVPASGGTKMLEIVMNGNAVSWMLDISNAEQGISFTDYPGETSITGNSTGVSVTVAANSSSNPKDYQVDGSFYDQYDNLLNMSGVWVRQDRFIAGTAVFNDTGSDSLVVPASWSGDVVVNVTVESGFYFDLQDANGTSIATGDTDASVTAMTASPNTASTQILNTFSCHFYSDSGMTSEVSTDVLYFTQQKAPVESMFECTYITTADSQTVKVASGEAGGRPEFSSAYVNGVNVISDLTLDGSSDWCYTFPSAGTNTITFTRENDPYLQEWFNNTDMVSFYGHSTIKFGFHSSTFDGSNQLTAITLGDTCNQLLSTTFNGASGITVMNCYMSSDNKVYDYDEQGAFATLANNVGTLHIPSGATLDYQNIIAGLGNNWTVVDDL